MKRIFDEATKKALSGLLPFAPGTSVPFTPEAFQKVEEAFRPIFNLRPYAKKERDYLAEHLKAGTYDKACISRAMENSGVIGWSNFFFYPDGEEIPFEKGQLENLPDVPFYQIHTHLMELTVGPTEVEKEGLP